MYLYSSPGAVLFVLSTTHPPHPPHKAVQTFKMPTVSSSPNLPIPQAPSQVTINNTLGAVFLGAIGASILYGITTLQVYMYYHRYLRDSRLHKVSVGILWILDSLHQALLIHTAYFLTFVESAGLSHIVWSTKLQVSINVVIVVIVQSLYAYRVWLLSGIHHGYLGFIVASFVAAGFVIGVVFAYLVYTASTFESLQGITWAIDASLAASTTIDFTISLAMCYYLKKSQGSEQRLNSKISTVMQYTLSSGLLTSAVSLSTLFTYTLMPNNLIFLGLQFLLTKFYVGSFLAMLNARHRPSNKAPGYSDVENGSHIKLTTPTRTQNSRWEFRVQTTVQTETFTESDIDPYSPQTMVADSERSGLSRTTTYASCQSDKAHKFDPTKTIDSSVIEYIESPASAVVPLHEMERYIASPRERKPDYMTQW